MSCRLCGAATSRRLCRQCEIEERAEERARARKRLDEDREDDNGDEDPELRSDGGTVGIDRIEAERRARQAARVLDQWSRSARLDLMEVVQEETPVGGESSSTSTSRSPQRPPSVGGRTEESTYHLVCRNCSFEAVSSGEDARDRLHRTRDIHRTAFGHEVIVGRIATSPEPPVARLQTDGGPDR